MSLESAEKLVQRILRQLRVEYRVEARPEGEGSRIVADVASLSSLPPELHPYVTPRQPEPTPTADEDGRAGSGDSPARRS